ncbi:MAG: ACT domain-containing protein [Rhodospirillales bacterium]
MAAETDLERLLSGLNPTLVEGVYVFATLSADRIPDGLRPLMVFREAEGTTLILSREEAAHRGIAYDFPCRMITLAVHSALDAVGLVARMATALADCGIPANPVSGYYHDHLFVPLGREGEALAVLQGLVDLSRQIESVTAE